MSDETWRVETATGAVMAMTVRAGPVGRWTCESCGRHKTQRAAVMARCLADGIDVVSIVGPGESTRAEALAVERRERAALVAAVLAEREAQDAYDVAISAVNVWTHIPPQERGHAWMEEFRVRTDRADRAHVALRDAALGLAALLPKAAP